MRRAELEEEISEVTLQLQAVRSEWSKFCSEYEYVRWTENSVLMREYARREAHYLETTNELSRELNQLEEEFENLDEE